MGGWVGSAPACYGNSLGSNPDFSQKYKMGGRYKQRSGHRTAVRQKTIYNEKMKK
jgi:hypothetical protein